MIKRRAVLVVVGNFAQALEAALAHRITTASSTVQDPHGLKSDKGGRCVTRITLDGEKYNEAIAAWLNEPACSPPVAGTLLRASWS